MYTTLGCLHRGAAAAGLFPAILNVSHASQSGGGTARSIVLPASISAGQKIVLVTHSNGAGTITPPSGFAAIGGVNPGFSDKTAVGTEGGTTLNFSISVAGDFTNTLAIVFDTYANGDIGASDFFTSGGVSDAPAATPAWGADDNLYVTILFFFGTPVTPTFPANCPLYQGSHLTGLAAHLCAAQSVLGTFNPDDWTHASTTVRRETKTVVFRK